MKVNRKKLDQFWSKRTKIKDSRIATHFKYDDTHKYDLKLIYKYIKPNSKVLDLGCGPCYITNKLIGKAKYIKGVDKFGGFLKHCKIGPNFDTQESDLLDYKDKNKYDLILLIGVMFCFGDKESEKIYRNCAGFLKKTGVMIIRQQYGVKKDVLIDKYSEQIGDNYYTYYRHIQKELKILNKFFKVKVIDLFPKKLNPWPDTHHYALVCKKKNG